MLPPELEAAYNKDEIINRLLKRRLFVVKVPKLGACWEWEGATRYGGYGVIGLRKYSQSPLAVHRLSAALWLDLDLEDSRHFACHRCDNPSCWNPAHLFTGTSSDNQQDAAKKGRHKNHRFIGTEHPKAKLTEADILAIRREYSAGGISQRALGKRYGVSNAQVSEIVNYKAWQHVA